MRTSKLLVRYQRWLLRKICVGGRWKVTLSL